MNLLLDILQGLGLGAAAGLRPFLPALAAGGLAAADLGIDFEDTSFAFLEHPVWLLVMATGVALALLLRSRVEEGPGRSALSGIGVGLGALLCAASIDDRHATWWYGLPLGLLAALVAGLAAWGLLDRVRGRLDREAAGALPLYAEALAVALAVASVLVPPISIVALGFFAWLLIGARRRAGEKYAGLRILR